jgi:hypothetical protein
LRLGAPFPVLGAGEFAHHAGGSASDLSSSTRSCEAGDPTLDGSCGIAALARSDGGASDGARHLGCLAIAQEVTGAQEIADAGAAGGAHQASEAEALLLLRLDGLARRRSAGSGAGD